MQQATCSRTINRPGAEAARRLLLLAVGAILSVCAPAAPHLHAGPWPREPGESYIKLSGSYLSTGKERNFRGDQLDIFEERLSYTDARYDDLNLNAYVEYGLTRRLTLVSQLPFKYVRAERLELGGAYFETRRVETTTAGFGDLGLALRYGFLDRGVVAAVQGGAKLPLGYDPTPRDSPPLGTGEVDYDVRLLFGGSLQRIPAYWSGGGGYRYRGGIYHNEYIYEVEFGITTTNWLFKIALDGIENSADPQDLVGAPVVTPLPGGGGSFAVVVGDQNYTKLTPSVSYAIGRGRWFTAELSTLLAGENTVDGTTLSGAFTFARWR